MSTKSKIPAGNPASTQPTIRPESRVTGMTIPESFYQFLSLSKTKDHADTKEYFRDVDKNREKEYIPSINRISSIADFFGTHLTNFAANISDKFNFPFCNQFRGSGKTRFGLILSDKKHILDHSNDIVNQLSLLGNLPFDTIADNELFLTKLFGSETKNIIKKKGNELAGDIFKKMLHLLEEKIERYPFAPNLYSTIHQVLKANTITENKTIVKQFNKIQIWHIDEAIDDNENQFRLILDDFFALYSTNFYSNSEILHLFYFSGNCSFEDFGHQKGSEKDIPSHMVPRWVRLEPFTEDELIELIDNYAALPEISNDVRTILNKNYDILDPKTQQKTKRTVKQLLAGLETLLFGGVPRASIGFMKCVLAFIKRNPQSFTNFQNYEYFASEVMDQETIRLLKSYVSESGQSGPSGPSPEAISLFINEKLFPNEKLRNYEVFNVKNNTFVDTFASEIAAKSMVYVGEHNGRLEMTRGLVTDLMLQQYFTSSLWGAFVSFQHSPFNIDLMQAVDEGKLLEIIIESYVVKSLLQLKSDSKAAKELVLFTNSTTVGSKSVPREFSRISFPKVTSGTNDSEKFQTNNLKNKTYQDLLRDLDTLDTISPKNARDVISKLVNFSQSSNTTLLLVPKPKSSSADLMVIFNGHLLEIQAKNMQDYALTATTLNEEFEKSFLCATIPGTLFFFVFEYSSNSAADVIFRNLLNIRNLTFDEGGVFVSANEVFRNGLVFQKDDDGVLMKHYPKYNALKDINNKRSLDESEERCVNAIKQEKSARFRVPSNKQVCFVSKQDFDSIFVHKYQEGKTHVEKCTTNFLKDFKGKEEAKYPHILKEIKRQFCRDLIEFYTKQFAPKMKSGTTRTSGAMGSSPYESNTKKMTIPEENQSKKKQLLVYVKKERESEDPVDVPYPAETMDALKKAIAEKFAVQKDRLKIFKMVGERKRVVSTDEAVGLLKTEEDLTFDII